MAFAVPIFTEGFELENTAKISLGLFRLHSLEPVVVNETVGLMLQLPQ